jgi:hypothetical protein
METILMIGILLFCAVLIYIVETQEEKPSLRRQKLEIDKELYMSLRKGKN